MTQLATTELTNTVTISAATMAGGAIGDLIPETTALFLDYDGATDIDGILLPLLVDRTALLVTPAIAPVSILAAVEVSFTVPTTTGVQRWFRISPSVQTDLRVHEKVSIGTFSGPSYIGAFRVEKRITVVGFPDDLVISTVNPRLGLVAGDLVGEELYEIHRYSGGAKLGFLSLNLGLGVSGAKVRAALIYTSTPNSGATYATREAANEVIWSRFYPVGTQVTVDFGGLNIFSQGFVPPAVPLAPSMASNAEKRLMLALYWESGIPVAFTLDADITYTINTIVEQNF
jgi:hypothetical protein